MLHTAQKKNMSALVVVLILTIICLCSALAPVITDRYDLRISRFLEALWRPLFWISLASAIVIAGRFLMTRFTYAIRLSSDQYPDENGYVYEGAPEQILGTPVYRSDELDFLVLRKTGLGRELKDLDLPVRSFVSFLEVKLRPFSPKGQVCRSDSENTDPLTPSKLYNYTSSFLSRKAALLLFSDGDRDIGVMIDDGNPVSEYFRKRSGADSNIT